jgi:predicted anti-sigma-YlaC factor YlaD
MSSFDHRENWQKREEPMADCDKIVAMLSEYLDRDLPPDTCCAIEAHLASCVSCGQAAQGLRETVDLCRSYRTESRPGPLAPDKHQEMRAAFQRELDRIREADPPPTH